MVVDITPKVRQVLYLVFALVGLALGATTVGFSTAEVPQPTWLKVAQAVLSFLAAGFGYTAASHTIVSDDRQWVPADGGEISVVTLVAVVLILAGALALFGVLSLLVVGIVALVSGIVLLLLGWSGRVV